MSGHSKWSTIKRQKGANDAKRGAIFTKLGNQIAIAARGGTDPNMNAALALAVEKAKAANMPSANIDRSIQRAADKSAAQMEEVLYEGYGPGGVAVLVECATDNRNRTLPEVRLAFSKTGGNMAEQGSVAFQFTRKGVIHVKGTSEDIQLQAIEAGADDVIEEKENDETVIYTSQNDLAKVRDQLKEAGLEIVGAELTYDPNNIVEISDAETARKIIRLMDALEDLDDVTNTYTNFDIADNVEVYMRLFLSSYRAGRHDQKLLELLGGINKVGYISNAKDYKPEEERTQKIKENFDYYRSIGIEPIEIDLRPFFGKPDAEKLLSDFKFVWLAGGNAFLLRRALKYTGLDEYLVDKVRAGSIIYGGESAGAIMAAPTLKGSEDDSGNEDDPRYIPKGYEEEIIWEGLGLIDYVAVPHYKTPGLVESIDGYVSYLEKHKIDFKTMTEDQAILIDGDKVEFLK